MTRSTFVVFFVLMATMSSAQASKLEVFAEIWKLAPEQSDAGCADLARAVVREDAIQFDLVHEEGWSSMLPMTLGTHREGKTYWTTRLDGKVLKHREERRYLRGLIRREIREDRFALDDDGTLVYTHNGRKIEDLSCVFVPRLPEVFGKQVIGAALAFPGTEALKCEFLPHPDRAGQEICDLGSFVVNFESNQLRPHPRGKLALVRLAGQKLTWYASYAFEYSESVSEPILDREMIFQRVSYISPYTEPSMKLGDAEISIFYGTP